MISFPYTLEDTSRITYVVPDGHDEDHGDAEGLVELVPSAHLGEAVAVTEHSELVLAELGGDVAGGGDARVGRGGDDELLAVLDEELGELVLGELADDAIRGVSDFISS